MVVLDKLDRIETTDRETAAMILHRMTEKRIKMSDCRLRSPPPVLRGRVRVGVEQKRSAFRVQDMQESVILPLPLNSKL
jgi:hypothetical protein